MNWKEFFWPYKNKIKVFVIPLIPIIFFGFTTYWHLCFFEYVSESVCSPIIAPFIIFSPTGFIISYFVPSCALSDLCWYLASFIFYPVWYLLSCLIIWIYDKVKKK